METLKEYGNRVINRVEEIKSLIESGSKFNGTVYGKNKGKGILLTVYIDGKEKLIAEVEKADADVCKAEFLNFVSVSTMVKETKTVYYQNIHNFDLTGEDRY